MMVRKAWIAFFLSWSICAAVYASEETQEEWNPPSAGPVTTSTAPLCSKGAFVVQPFFFYSHTRGSFSSHGDYASLPAGESMSAFQQQLSMKYGITDRLEIDAQTVYQENYAKAGGVKAHDSGIGDSVFSLRYCVLEEKKYLPHITGVFQLKTPTGKYEHGELNKLGTDIMGGGSWDPGLVLVLTKRLKPFIVHGDIAYSFPQRVRIDGIKTHYANYLNYDASVEYFLPKGFNLMLEANGYAQADSRQDGSRTPSTSSSYLTISPGIGWSCQAAQFLLAYQRVVCGVNVDATDSVVLTAIYTF